MYSEWPKFGALDRIRTCDLQAGPRLDIEQVGRPRLERLGIRAAIVVVLDDGGMTVSPDIYAQVPFKLVAIWLQRFIEAMTTTGPNYKYLIYLIKLAHPRGFEPLASAFGGQRQAVVGGCAALIGFKN